MIARAARSRSAVSSTTTGGFPGPATTARLPEFRAARATAGPPVTQIIATSGCRKMMSAVSSVGSVITQIRLSMPRSSKIASLNRCTPSDATRLPLGWGFTTNVFPPAIMLIALPVIVGSEWVTGVIAPMTPNGACSMTASPLSPLNTWLFMNSMPGVRLPRIFSFSILCGRRPISGFVHLQRPELHALVDRDAANVIDDALAIGHRAFGQLQERVSCCAHGFIRTGELSVAP